jgi:hypothetical protein
MSDSSSRSPDYYVEWRWWDLLSIEQQEKYLVAMFGLSKLCSEEDD